MTYHENPPCCQVLCWYHPDRVPASGRWFCFRCLYQVYLGDIVTLQGYSTGSPTVYLFLPVPIFRLMALHWTISMPVRMRGISLRSMSTATITGYTAGARTRGRQPRCRHVYGLGSGQPDGSFPRGGSTSYLRSPWDLTRRNHLGIPVTPLVPVTMDLSSSPNETSSRCQ